MSSSSNNKDGFFVCGDKQNLKNVLQAITKSAPTLPMFGVALRSGSDHNAMTIHAMKTSPDSLQILHVLNCPEPITGEVLSVMGEFAKGLRHLGLIGTPLAPGALEGNENCLKNLTAIDLGSDNPAETISRDMLPKKLLTRDPRDPSVNEVLRSVADHCQKLELVNLSGPENAVDDDTLGYFLDKVKGSLKEMTICGDRLTDQSYLELRKCTLLKRLEVSTHNLGTQGLETILELPNLMNLKMTKAEGSLDNKDMARIMEGRKMERLISLRLSGFEDMDESFMEALAVCCHRMIKLDLSDCQLTAKGVVSVIEKSPQLRSIVGICPLSKDDDEEELVGAFKVLLERNGKGDLELGKSGLFKKFVKSGVWQMGKKEEILAK